MNKYLFLLMVVLAPLVSGCVTTKAVTMPSGDAGAQIIAEGDAVSVGRGEVESTRRALRIQALLNASEDRNLWREAYLRSLEDGALGNNTTPGVLLVNKNPRATRYVILTPDPSEVSTIDSPSSSWSVGPNSRLVLGPSDLPPGDYSFVVTDERNRVIPMERLPEKDPESGRIVIYDKQAVNDVTVPTPRKYEGILYVGGVITFD